jgi:hypothetical protein
MKNKYNILITLFLPIIIPSIMIGFTISLIWAYIRSTQIASDKLIDKMFGLETRDERIDRVVKETLKEMQNEKQI